MIYSQILSELKDLEGRGMNFGVLRTRKLLDALASPDGKLKIIHIAGTNGKGSVAEYLTRILIAAGKRTGTFTSPAVFEYTEQFKIDGVPVDESLFKKGFLPVIPLAQELGATRFEAETAGALNTFALGGCEYAVIECGLGGLNDATNAINKKEVAVITSISLEHTAVLGSTLEEICAQKSGIIKDCQVVVSALQPEEVKAFFKNKGALFAEKPIEIISGMRDGQQVFTYGGNEFVIQMAGAAQPYNAATAIETARLLKIDDGAIYLGIKAAKLGGRLEVINAKSAVYILDGAHNPASFVPLAQFIKSKFGKADNIIFGCLADKDIDGNLKALTDTAKKVIAVKPTSQRAMDIDKITLACKKNFTDVCVADSVENALVECSGAKTVVVCGSFTLLKEAKAWIEKRL